MYNVASIRGIIVQRLLLLGLTYLRLVLLLLRGCMGSVEGAIGGSGGGDGGVSTQGEGGITVRGRGGGLQGQLMSVGTVRRALLRTSCALYSHLHH